MSAELDQLLASPPPVHALDGEGTGGRLGVWAATDDCLALIDQRLTPGARTLETGLGLSTALFAARGAHHVAVVSVAPQAERLLEYCQANGIPTDHLELVIGFSEDHLPHLGTEPLDLVLIDGGHGFPTPIIDWHYAVQRLRVGGVAIVDDIGLPAVRALVRFVDRDPRFRRVAGGKRWIAYERVAEGVASEDWWEQPWAPWDLAARVRRQVNRVLGRARRMAAARRSRG